MPTNGIYIGIILLCIYSNKVLVATMAIENPEQMKSNGSLPEPLGLMTSNRAKREINVDSSSKYFRDISNIMPSYCELKEVKIVSLHYITKVGERLKDRQLLKSDSSYLTNEGHSPRDAFTHSFQYKKVIGDSLSVSNTIGFTGNIELPIPKVNKFAPSIQFTNQQTTTKSETIEESMTYPSQKVTLSPRTKVRVDWKIYREETDTKYRAAFVAKPVFQIKPVVEHALDPIGGASFIFGLFTGFNPVDRVKDLGVESCDQYFKEIDFKRLENINYNKWTNKLTFRNFDVLRTVHHDEFVVVFGNEEPL